MRRQIIFAAFASSLLAPVPAARRTRLRPSHPGATAETIVVTVNFMWVRPPERAETLRSSDVRRGDRGLDLTLASIEENHGSEAA